MCCLFLEFLAGATKKITLYLHRSLNNIPHNKTRAEYYTHRTINKIKKKGELNFVYTRYTITSYYNYFYAIQIKVSF